MIDLHHVVREFKRGEAVVHAVDGVSLTVERGEFVAIMGKSGSGKSTLLHLMSGLLTPSAGQVRLLGQDVSRLSDDSLTVLRRNRIGFIFQFFNLLPTLTAAENVALPLLLSKVNPKIAQTKALELLEVVGLAARAHHKPDELSGGQMQRVAIARALVNAPPLLFADEPTGNLDSHSGEEILELLRSTHRQKNQTIVMVTHDERAAAHGTRIITLEDGMVIGDHPTTARGSGSSPTLPSNSGWTPLHMEGDDAPLVPEYRNGHTKPHEDAAR